MTGFIMVGLFRCVPVSVPFSDLLKSWGGVWRAHVWYVWATVVVLIYVDAGARALHRSCLRHRSIYSTFGGNVGCWVQCRRAHDQFWYSVPMGEDCILYDECNIYEGLPDDTNKPAQQIAHLKWYKVFFVFRTVNSTTIAPTPTKKRSCHHLW